MPRPTLPTHFKDMRTYPVQLTKTTEEQLKEHMLHASETYDEKVKVLLDEQRRMLDILAYENPYMSHSWRKGSPERRFKHGYDALKLSEDKVDQDMWCYNIARDFEMCVKEFKWNDEWVHDFRYKIEQTRETMRENSKQIKEQDELTFELARKNWMEKDAEWIARENLRKEHVYHKPKSYFIELFKRDKDAERFYDGQIPNYHETCEFCIHDKIVREAYEEKARKDAEEYERLREEQEEEYRRKEEEERKRREAPVERKEHKCEACNYKTMDSAMFRIHLMSKEHIQTEKQKNLYCEACDHQCRCKIEYEAHIRTSKHKKNTGEKQEPTVYTCEACAYSTPFKHHFDNHTKSKKHQDKMTQEVVIPTTA